MPVQHLCGAANISDGFMFSDVGPMPLRYVAASNAGFDAVKHKGYSCVGRKQKLFLVLIV